MCMRVYVCVYVYVCVCVCMYVYVCGIILVITSLKERANGGFFFNF